MAKWSKIILAAAVALAFIACPETAAPSQADQMFRDPDSNLVY